MLKNSSSRRSSWPLISIVTPSFNQGVFLEDCIDSVLSQNYPNLEFIIMDGGSTDNSFEIIKKYERFLTYWQSGPDGGQYAAITEGFRRTSGEIMSWLNSDDKFHPNAFFIVAAVFMNRPDVEWITGRSNTLNEKGEQSWICEYANRYSRSKYLKKEYSSPWIQQEGTFWRRKLWEMSGATLRSELEYAGDLELWVRFFRITRLFLIDALLAGYRFQPSSKTRLSMDKYLKEANWILDQENQFFREGAPKELLSPPDPIGTTEIRKALAMVEKVNPAIAMNFFGADANLALKSGHQLALEFYERSKKSGPNSCGLHNSLGMLYWQDGEVKKAIGEFVKALRINPNFPDAIINLGDVLTRIKMTEKAEKLYSSYLALNPHGKNLPNIDSINNS
jgi:tetratricopeptide (TPR) repeat protein